MEEMLTPPADRPRPRPWRLVLLMGMTALLYLVIFGGIQHQTRSIPTLSIITASNGAQN